MGDRESSSSRRSMPPEGVLLRRRHINVPVKHGPYQALKTELRRIVYGKIYCAVIREETVLSRFFHAFSRK